MNFVKRGDCLRQPRVLRRKFKRFQISPFKLEWAFAISYIFRMRKLCYFYFLAIVS